MKNTACPLCGGKEIYSSTSVKNKSGINQSNTIPISLFRFAVLENHVCGDCGYVQSFIAREKDLASIKKKWPLVM